MVAGPRRFYLKVPIISHFQRGGMGQDRRWTSIVRSDREVMAVRRRDDGHSPPYCLVGLASCLSVGDRQDETVLKLRG